MPYRIPAAILLVACALGAEAQRGPGGFRPAGQAYGRLLDGSRKPVPFASISILQGDSVVGGALVQDNGDFSITKLPLGQLRLRAVAMGYSTLDTSFTLTPEQPVRDLGNLRIAADAVVLQAAEVTKERATQVLQVDRRVYNVEKDISAAGGDATDVMKRIPGLSVDAEGNVEMRGKSPRVFVDGRPTTLTLDQIPAADIERVEVITNPSVIFDANAMGGIVNVVLKKSLRPGFSGQVQAGIGTDRRYNANGNFQVRQGRSAFNLGLGFGYGASPGRGYSRRTDLSDGLPTGYFNQDATQENNHLRQHIRLGWDYNLSVRNTISLMQSASRGNRGGTEDQVFTTMDGARNIIGSGTQRNTSDGSNTDFTTRAGFKRTTLKPGKEWSTDLTWNFGDRNSPATTEQYNQGGLMLQGNSVQHRNSRVEEQEWTWQFDLTDAYADNRKLEWGFKADYEQQRSSMQVTYGNDTLQGLLPDTALSNAYLIHTLVNAAYINWSTRLNAHWSMQAGLRLEQNRMVADRTDLDQSFSYNYPDGLDDLGRILFPGVYLSRKWAAPEGDLQRELQVNLSRKVNRPNHWQMMPYLMPVDARSYRQGNPTLLPEMSTIVEVNHLLPLGESGNWLSSAYARFTSDVITSYTLPMAEDPNILVASYVNGDGNQGFGWENTVKLTLWKGLEATLNGNVQWVQIGLSQGSSTYSNTGINFDGKVNLSQKLPKGFTVQVNADYDSPRVIPQGHTLERYSLDISARKELGKHFAITISADNLLDSRGWGTYYEMPSFEQESFRTWGTRSFRLNASWRFGKQDTTLFRRKGGQTEHRVPGTGGGDEGGGE